MSGSGECDNNELFTESGSDTSHAWLGSQSNMLRPREVAWDEVR
jgi:hypothetical protein